MLLVKILLTLTLLSVGVAGISGLLGLIINNKKAEEIIEKVLFISIICGFSSVIMSLIICLIFDLPIGGGGNYNSYPVYLPVYM